MACVDDDLATDHALLEATVGLGAALRAALAASVSTSAPVAALREAADDIRKATALLQAQLRPASQLSPLDDVERGIRVFNPVLGHGNGMAVPLHFEHDGERVVARATLGRVFEGPPTFLHGGMSAMLMDQVLGEAAIQAGRWGLTVRLDLQYRGPVPLHTPLRLTSWIAETSNRRTTVTGTIATDSEPDVPLVEATGIFVTPSGQTLASYFRTVRTASGRETDFRLRSASYGGRPTGTDA